VSEEPMAELSTLARPYAKAAFAHAQQSSDLSGWSSALATAAAVSQNEKIGELLDDPQQTSDVRAEKFLAVCGDFSASQQNFIKLLAENHRMALLPEIFHLFEVLKADAESTLEVEVLSA